MKLYRVVILFALFAAPVAAQSHSDIVAQAIFDVSGSGNATASDWCQVLKVSNTVAWRLWANHAAPAPFGLLHKEGGTRAVLRPDGSCTNGNDSRDPNGFALDYVIDRSTGYGRDIVTSWGAAQWPEPPEMAADMVARNFRDFREPFDPASYLGGAQPPVVVTPGVVLPNQPPAAVFDAAALSAQIAQLQLSLDTHVRGLGEAIAVVNDNVSAGRAENRSAWAKVADHWKSIVMIASPTASWWIARVTGHKAQ